MKSQTQINASLELIEKWDEMLRKLVGHFQSQYLYEITDKEILEALFLTLEKKKHLEWIGDVWDVEIEFEEVLTLLSNFNFESLKNKVETQEGLIPNDLLFQFKVKIKSKGQIWIIHKYDADPFPSNPHAHDITNNIKLDLSNGNCYRIKEYIYTIKRKDLLLIRQKIEEKSSILLPKLLV